MESSKRIAYVDFIKCLAIFFVILGHAVMQYKNIHFPFNEGYLIIYSFHMPLFMLISGMFVSSSFKLKAYDLCRKKFRQIMIPYIIFTALCSVILLSYGQVFTLSSFAIWVISGYWFLPTLFLSYIFVCLLFKLGKFKKVAIIILILLVLYLQRYNTTVFKLGAMLPFFIVGIIVRRYLQSIFFIRYLLLLITAIVFSICIYFYSYSYVFSNFFFPTISINNILKYLFYIITGLAGSFVIISLSMIIYNNNNYVMRTLSKIGKYTLGIYLLQKVILEIILSHYINADMNIWLYDMIVAPIISVVLLYVCYRLTLLLKKYQFTRRYFIGDFSRA